MTHGTNGGYVAHIKGHSKICQPCRDAHNKYMRKFRHGGDGEKVMSFPVPKKKLGAPAPSGTDRRYPEILTLTASEFAKERGYDAERRVYV